MHSAATPPLASLDLDDRERRYPELYEQFFLPLYQSSREGTFSGVGKVPIHYRILHHPAEKGTIVLLPGRTESHLKYAETIYDLYHAGFSVFTLDHRGQGFSGRMTPDREVGYVDCFEDYVTDLHTFMTTIVEKEQGANLFFLAHSMGATIASLYILKYQPPLRGVVFSSPMLQIDLGNIPTDVVYAAVRLKCLLGLGQQYIVKPGKIDVDTYGADLTQSTARLTHYRSILRDNPLIRLGSPSNMWMRRSIESTRSLLEKNALLAIRCPLLLLEAAKDSVVRIKANQKFEGVSSWHVRASFPEAYHDLFIERDDVRKKALTMMFLFMLENSKP